MNINLFLILLILSLIYINFYYFNKKEKFKELNNEIVVDDLNSIEGIWKDKFDFVILTIKKNCNKTNKDCKLILNDSTTSSEFFLKIEDKGIIDDVFFSKFFTSEQLEDAGNNFYDHTGKIYYKLEILIDQDDIDVEISDLVPKHIVIILNNDNTINILGLETGVYSEDVLSEKKNLYNAGCDTFKAKGESIEMCKNICTSRGCNNHDYCHTKCISCSDIENCKWLSDDEIITINKPILNGYYVEKDKVIILQWSFCFEEENLNNKEDDMNVYIINYFNKNYVSNIKNYTEKASNFSRQNNMVNMRIKLSDTPLELELNKSYTFFIVPTNGKIVGSRSNEITINLGTSNVSSFDDIKKNKPGTIGNNDYDDINFNLDNKEKNILDLKKKNKCEEIIKQDTHFITKPSLLSSLKGKNLEISL